MSALTYPVRGWYRLVRAGESLEVADEDFERFYRLGAVVKEGDAPAVKQKAEPAPEPASEKAPAVPVGEVERPAKAASLARWREYAESVGVETKGMSKAELIAATK